MKFDNQLRYGSSIIAAYGGEIPLHAWLKNYFREHKQMGSRDRKLISSMAYGFYRLGHAIPAVPVSATEERILAGLFLCNESPSELLQYFKPEWNENITKSTEEKLAIYSRSDKQSSNLPFDLPAIFPWKDALSEGVDHPAFCLSFLHQPDLFLRIRPGHTETVMGKLKERGVDFVFLPPFTVRLPNGSRAEEWVVINKEVIVQDYNSQRTAAFLQIPSSEKPVESIGAIGVIESPASGGSSKSLRSRPTVWDACAASGGKSLLVHDINPGIGLTVSDIRESILHNLKERFREAGIKNYQSFVADLGADGAMSGGLGSKQGQGHAGTGYDLVIADVPCSGSGTWGRTPEELCFFDKKKIGEYRELQRRIVTNLIPAVKPGGHFVYITCSVFREENEGQVAFILENSGLKLERMELLKGYDQRADTMFVARFIA